MCDHDCVGGAGRARGLLIASALVGVVITVAACGPPPSHAPDETLAMESFFRELRVVRVQSSAGPLTLLFDTGGGATAITPAAARRMKCVPAGRDVGHRMSGERVEFRQCERLDLELGSWRTTLSPVAVFDVNALLPAELRTLDGVLALDAFRGRVLTIDWPNNVVRISDEVDAPESVVPYRVGTGDNGRYVTALLPVESTSSRLWFLLDSGNIAGTLVAAHSADLLTVSPSGTASLRVAGRPAVTLPTTRAEIILDGALGTSYLMATGPLTLDLRGAMPARLPD